MQTEMKNKKTAKIANILGSILAIMSIVFVFFKIKDNIMEIDTSKISTLLLIYFFTLSLAYGLNNLLLTFAWRNILYKLGNSITCIESIKLFGISQLAKYIPGNIFQFAGRQALCMAEKIPAKPVIKSAIYETVLIIIASLNFLPIVLSLMSPSTPLIFFYLSSISLVLVTSSIFIKFFERNLLISYLQYLIFFVFSGFIFHLVLSAFSQDRNQSLELGILTLSAFVISWLVGYITPGAPAGVGVREIVILFFLHNHFNESDLLLSVAVCRVITILGDIFYYLLALAIKHKNVNLNS